MELSTEGGILFDLILVFGGKILEMIAKLLEMFGEFVELVLSQFITFLFVLGFGQFLLIDSSETHVSTHCFIRCDCGLLFFKLP